MARQNHFYKGEFERLGWLECVGKKPGTTAKLWSGTRKAWRVLGLAGWEVEGAA